MKTLLLAIASFGAIASPALARTELSLEAELRQAALEWFEPIPDVPQPPVGNVLTPERGELGAMLFFDPRMSRSGVF